MSTANAWPLLLDPAELRDRLDEPGLRVIDLSPPELYERNHVPGSIHLPYARLVRQAPPVGGLLPEPETLARVFSEAGIDAATHVVALDAEGGGAAGRLMWTLEALGYAQASILDGGLVAWVNEDYPVRSGDSPIPAEGTFPEAELHPEPTAATEAIQARLGCDDFIALDARSHGEFTGETVRATRGGHIPGARHYEWTRALDRGRNLRLRPLDEVADELERLGITHEREVVVYCHTHHRSALSYALLRILGYPRVRGYPGSWSDWGNRQDTPVETGD
jgi:thiosulfate/3-mercaptopyruvate sulfurtransferase